MRPWPTPAVCAALETAGTRGAYEVLIRRCSDGLLGILPRWSVRRARSPFPARKRCVSKTPPPGRTARPWVGATNQAPSALGSNAGLCPYGWSAVRCGKELPGGAPPSWTAWHRRCGVPHPESCLALALRGSFPRWIRRATPSSAAPTGALLCASSRRSPALSGELPEGARPRPTFPRELQGRGSLVPPCRRPLGPTARSPGQRYGGACGPGSVARRRLRVGARGGLRTQGVAPSWARGAGCAAPSTPWTDRPGAASRWPCLCSRLPGRHAAFSGAASSLRRLKAQQIYLAFLARPRSPGKVLLGGGGVKEVQEMQVRARRRSPNPAAPPDKPAPLFQPPAPRAGAPAPNRLSGSLMAPFYFFAAHPGAHWAACRWSLPGFGVLRSASPVSPR